MGRWGDADARSLVRDSKNWYPRAGGVMRVKSGNNRNNQLILFMQSFQIKNPVLY
jgi:hypothetical protein